ncbi:MAG TPA: DEAD/DEAH box helicase, partial [Ilumatobacteraceae bacterium]
MPDLPARLGAGRGRKRRPHKSSDETTPEVREPSPSISTVDTPTGFAALGVPPDIDAGLAAAGFSQPFAIQTEAIPVALTGVDVCGRARTGSGKTLAFGVPMLARLSGKAQPNKPRGLILVPTRELALQVAEVLEPVARACGYGVLAVYGGSSRHKQIDDLNAGVEVVVATPLRLIDLLKNNEL